MALGILNVYIPFLNTQRLHLNPRSLVSPGVFFGQIDAIDNKNK